VHPLAVPRRQFLVVVSTTKIGIFFLDIKGFSVVSGKGSFLPSSCCPTTPSGIDETRSLLQSAVGEEMATIVTNGELRITYW
jgi:hypothetical protein